MDFQLDDCSVRRRFRGHPHQRQRVPANTRPDLLLTNRSLHFTERRGNQNRQPALSRRLRRLRHRLRNPANPQRLHDRRLNYIRRVNRNISHISSSRNPVPTPLVPNILSESPCESRRNIFLNIASLVRCIGHFVTVIRQRVCLVRSIRRHARVRLDILSATDAAGDKLVYNLYTDADRNTVWGTHSFRSVPSLARY
jgi:hypothetical protein